VIEVIAHNVQWIGTQRTALAMRQSNGFKMRALTTKTKQQHCYAYEFVGEAHTQCQGMVS